MISAADVLGLSTQLLATTLTLLGLILAFCLELISEDGGGPTRIHKVAL